MKAAIRNAVRHWADPVSHHRRIALSFIWVGFFVFVGKLVATAKEIAIASRYGVSATVDAYVFVLNLVSWPVSLWFSVLTVVLIPLVARARAGNQNELPRFRGELLGLTLLVGIVLAMAGIFGLPILLNTALAGLSRGVLNEALNMVGPLSLLMPLGLVVGLFSVWMMACGRHHNTLFEALPALTILIALLLPAGWVPEPLVWGTVAGFALQMASLGLPLRHQGELERPLLGLQSPVWQSFWTGLGIIALGQALMGFTGIIDQFFAAHLAPGAIATLNYANRIMAVILGLGATAITRATLPIFSEVATRGDGPAVYRLAMHWAKLMFALGLAVVMVGWVFAPWAVKLLFQRGAFTPTDTIEVVRVARYLVVQTPVYYFALVLVAALSCQKKYAVLLAAGMLAVLIKMLSNLLLVTPLGVGGIALGVAIVYAIVSLYLGFKLKQS